MHFILVLLIVSGRTDVATSQAEYVSKDKCEFAGMIAQKMFTQPWRSVIYFCAPN